MTDPRRIGWVQTDKEGPCVDPYEHGPHMADGGICNAARIAEQDPPIMCLECYEELRAVKEPEGPWS